MTVVFTVGVAAGIALRPVVGSIARHFTLSSTSDPQPLDLVLWNTMRGQFRELDRVAPGPKLVYLGDSITDRMRVEEALTFTGGRVVNRSVSGDTTLGVLRRIRDSFPENVEACFVLLGANDLSRGASTTSVAGRIEAIVRALIERGVKHVVVESILPSTKVDESRVLEANGELHKITERVHSTTFLDLFTSFSKTGQRDASLYSDGVHLNQRGMLMRLRLEVTHLAHAAPALASRITVSELDR